MAETKLVLTFGVSGGGETTMTLSDAKASMSKETIGAAMTAMVDANCFATSKGAAYTEASAPSTSKPPIPSCLITPTIPATTITQPQA